MVIQFIGDDVPLHVAEEASVIGVGLRKEVEGSVP